MILNNYRGMEFIRTENPQALSPDFILTLHRILTEAGVSTSSLPSEIWLRGCEEMYRGLHKVDILTTMTSLPFTGMMRLGRTEIVWTVFPTSTRRCSVESTSSSFLSERSEVTALT